MIEAVNAPPMSPADVPVLDTFVNESNTSLVSLTRSSCVGGETLSHFQPRPTLKTMASLIKDCRTAVSRLAPGMFFQKVAPVFQCSLFQDVWKVSHFQDFEMVPWTWILICDSLVPFFIKLSALWPASGALASLASSKSFHAEPGSATLCATRIH